MQNDVMERTDFLKKIFRYLLLFMLTLIVLALGNKVVTGKDCSACPGKGNCNGNTDCSKY